MPARPIIEASIPDVVWHGTTKDFTVFDMGKADDGAHFFSADPSHAAHFGPARPYHIRINNPLEITQDDLEARWDVEVDDDGESGILPRDMVKSFVLQAKQAGHDGLIVRRMADLDLQADVFLPFTAEQITPAELPATGARRVIEAASIQFGWVRGDHVVKARFQADGEDNHHMGQNHLLPDDEVHTWKRWRYNSELETVFWWEAPTVGERDAVEIELGPVNRHVFVELNSSPPGDRAKARKMMPTANLSDLEQSDDPIEHGAGADLLDVTHYQDRPLNYVDRWLRQVGD